MSSTARLPRRPLLVRLVPALAAALVTTLLAATPAPFAAASGTVVLDGVTVRLAEGTRQVITVNRTHGSHARVTYWGRRDGRWLRKAQTAQGRIGYGGMVTGTKRRQSTGTTPLGTYPIPFTFGSKARKNAWAMPYRRVDSDDYWVLDNASAHYNRWRDRDSGGFRWRLKASDPNASERLADYSRQYEMAAVIGFNYDQPVRHRGGAIFLHVNGSGATGGCVGVPRWFMRTTLARLRPKLAPEIAIGR